MLPLYKKLSLIGLVGSLTFVASTVTASPANYFSISKSDRGNESITVIAGADILYDNTAFTKFEFSKQIYEDNRLGLVLDMNEDADTILGYAGYFVGDDWFYSVEQATFSGVFAKDESRATAFDTFTDNSYLDIKILSTPTGRGGMDGSVSIGFQLLSYDRPSGFKQNGVYYYDKAVKTNFLGFVMELDSVKEKVMNGKNGNSLDWYFYNTTAFGFGNMETSDTRAVNNPTVKVEPSQSSWFGMGMNGEYELGMVLFQRYGGTSLAIKAGYHISLEGPLMFHDGTFDDISDTIHPDEQLVTHGVNFSLSMSL